MDLDLPFGNGRGTTQASRIHPDSVSRSHLRSSYRKGTVRTPAEWCDWGVLFESPRLGIWNCPYLALLPCFPVEHKEYGQEIVVGFRNGSDVDGAVPDRFTCRRNRPSHLWCLLSVALWNKGQTAFPDYRNGSSRCTYLGGCGRSAHAADHRHPGG